MTASPSASRRSGSPITSIVVILPSAIVNRRAALSLTEAVTRLNDRADPVPDEVWNEAARHYDERSLAALVLSIAVINVWNRLNVATRQVAGEWVKSAQAREWLESQSASR